MRRNLRIGAAVLAAGGVAALAIGVASGSRIAAARPAVKPADAGLASRLVEARLATARYATSLARAKTDGYGVITQMIPNMGWHFMNPKVKGFDVRKPAILVYEKRGSTWQLGA